MKNDRNGKQKRRPDRLALPSNSPRGGIALEQKPIVVIQAPGMFHTVSKPWADQECVFRLKGKVVDVVRFYAQFCSRVGEML